MDMRLAVTVAPAPSRFMRAIRLSVASAAWTIAQRRSWIGTTSPIASPEVVTVSIEWSCPLTHRAL